MTESYSSNELADSTAPAPAPVTPKKEEAFRFDTPLYLQRYDYTLDVIRKYDCKTQIDIGCADCKLIKFVKNTIDSMNLLVGVDLDDECLANAKVKFNENFMDLMHMRQDPLEVYFIRGDISKPAPYFLETLSHTNIRLDLVSMVEVIEHMHAPTLRGCVQTVFGKLKPRVVLITTPNGEFNVVFDHFKTREGPTTVDTGESFGETTTTTGSPKKPANNGFRHWDHKFEWTRREFEAWCQSEILAQFSDYELVCYDGLGVAPSHLELEKDVGFCTQIAVIKRKDEYLAAEDSCHQDDGNALSRHLKKLKRANYVKQRTSLSLQQSLYHTEPFIQHEKFGAPSWEFGETDYRVVSFIRYPFEAIEYENEEERERDALAELKYLISFMVTRPSFRSLSFSPLTQTFDTDPLYSEDGQILHVEINKLATFPSMKKFKFSNAKIVQLLRESNYTVSEDDKYLIHDYANDDRSDDWGGRSVNRFGGYEDDEDEDLGQDVSCLNELNETWSIDTEAKKQQQQQKKPSKHKSSGRSAKKSSSKKRSRRDQQPPLDPSQFEDLEENWDDIYSEHRAAAQDELSLYQEKEICYFQIVNLEAQQRLAKLKKKRAKQSKLMDPLEFSIDFTDLSSDD